MTRILLVFTGGTIGSSLTDGTIDTDGGAAFKLISLFRQHDADAGSVEFKTLQPLQILSENLHPRAWATLIGAIEAEDLSQFDGIIVTHGTDTLAYTASTLAMYFHGLDIPLLLVSSDRPLDDPQANGLANFRCAVAFIRQKLATGAFVPYRNPGSDMQLHIATRLLSCLPLGSDFISAGGQPLMRYADGTFTQLHPLPQRPSTRFALQNRFDSRILLIRPYPGLDYGRIELSSVDAVLHDLYHSGTACSSRQWGDQHALTTFVERCRQAGVPIFMAPSILSESAYGSTRELLDAGADMLWNISLESAYGKLLLAFGSFDSAEMRTEFLQTSVNYEQL